MRLLLDSVVSNAQALFFRISAALRLAPACDYFGCSEYTVESRDITFRLH